MAMDASAKKMYGVAMISRLLQIIGLFWKRALYKRLNSAKATCNFKEPTKIGLWKWLWMHERKTCMGWLHLVGSFKMQVSFAKELWKWLRMHERKTCMGWLHLVGSFKIQVSFAKELWKWLWMHERKTCMGWLHLVGSFKMQVSFAKELWKWLWMHERKTCMGWLHLVGSFEMQVSFAKEYRSLLQKSYGNGCGCMSERYVWGGYTQQAPSKYRSLLRKSPIKETIFCKSDL